MRDMLNFRCIIVAKIFWCMPALLACTTDFSCLNAIGAHVRHVLQSLVIRQEFMIFITTHWTNQYLK